MNVADRKIYDDFKLFPVFKAGLNKTPAIPKGTTWKTDVDNNQIFSSDKLTTQTYGLVCGEQSGVMVLDIDSKDTPADELMKALVEKVGLNERDQQSIADTLTIKTPNNGFHLYFKYKAGLTNINS